MFFSSRQGARRQEYVLVMTCVVALILQGCMALQVRHPLPEHLQDQAQVDDLPGIRAWGDTYSESLEQSGIESIKQEMDANHGKLEAEANFLARSGYKWHKYPPGFEPASTLDQPSPIRAPEMD